MFLSSHIELRESIANVAVSIPPGDTKLQSFTEYLNNFFNEHNFVSLKTNCRFAARPNQGSIGTLYNSDKLHNRRYGNSLETAASSYYILTRSRDCDKFRERVTNTNQISSDSRNYVDVVDCCFGISYRMVSCATDGFKQVAKCRSRFYSQTSTFSRIFFAFISSLSSFSFVS